MPQNLDCLIVGGGPAGLTAAIYLARFRLRVRVVDAGNGRASVIPCTRNHAGFPEGISGAELVGRMRAQAIEYGADVQTDRVRGLRMGEDGRIVSETDSGDTQTARSVLLATGVTNHRPTMTEETHRDALAAGRLRYCPICDGYEVTDQEVGVIGTGARGLKEALFLRAYTRAVSLMPPEGGHTLTDDDRRQAADAGVALIETPASGFELEEAGISMSIGGQRRRFEAIYPAMGSSIHSSLAADLGAARIDDGCITVDAHQRTSVRGLYAAGDVVSGLDQISHAMGEAGVAATAIRNDLADIAPLRR